MSRAINRTFLRCAINRTQHMIRVHDVIKTVFIIFFFRSSFLRFYSLPFCGFADDQQNSQNKGVKQNAGKTPQDSTPNSSCLNNSAINLFSHFEIHSAFFFVLLFRFLSLSVHILIVSCMRFV